MNFSSFSNLEARKERKENSLEMRAGDWTYCHVIGSEIT